MGFWNRLKEKASKKEIKVQDKIALCLSGGGARGFAHIGAIKAFEEEHIDFDLVAGVSAGSIVGALYSAGISADDMILYSEKIELKEVHNGMIIAPNDASKIGRLVTNLIGNCKIEDLKKKFVCVAVDLVESKQVVMDSGDVGKAVSASACVPLLFKPVVYGKKHLVDGGLLNNIPADVCRMLGADKVVTVDINPTRGGGTADLSLIAVLKAAFNIMSANSSLQGLMRSDIVIAPDMSHFSASSKDGWQDMIQLGYKTAKNYIGDIKALQEKSLSAPKRQ